MYFHAIVERAHERGLKVVGHVPNDVTLDEALEASTAMAAGGYEPGPYHLVEVWRRIGTGTRRTEQHRDIGRG